MRHFIVCRLVKHRPGARLSHLAVSAINPVRAAELYAQHLADCMPTAYQPTKYNTHRMTIEVMEIAVDSLEGVRVAMHSEGDLYYSALLGADGAASVTFLEKASEYAADGETKTGDWHPTTEGN
jgi:hypothetical protein